MLKYLFATLLAASVLFSCQPKTENKEETAETKEVKSSIPWEKGEKITEAVDNYFNANAFDKNKETLTLDNNGTPVEAVIVKVNKETLMQTADDKGVVPVSMKGAGEEEILADYMLTWDANLPATSDTIPGGFKVESVSVREFKGEKRYSWEKQGNFFVKK